MDVREKLVELLNKANSACVGTDCFEGCKFYMENDCLYKLMADVMIENGVTVQEWISVKDRLPEECPHPYADMTKAVLIYTPADGYTHIGWYAGKDWRGRDEWKTLSAMRSYQTCTKKVSHWCYLPQPPKGE